MAVHTPGLVTDGGRRRSGQEEEEPAAPTERREKDSRSRGFVSSDSSEGQDTAGF